MTSLLVSVCWWYAADDDDLPQCPLRVLRCFLNLLPISLFLFSVLFSTVCQLVIETPFAVSFSPSPSTASLVLLLLICCLNCFYLFNFIYFTFFFYTTYLSKLSCLCVCSVTRFSEQSHGVNYDFVVTPLFIVQSMSSSLYNLSMIYITF